MPVDSPTPDSSRIASVIRATVARPWTALILSLIVTAAAGWWGSKIHIAGDMEALFPEDTPTIARAKEARELVGSHSAMIVLIGSEDRELNRRVGRDIATRLATYSDDIARVDFERDTTLFETNALLYLPVEELKKLDEQVAEVVRAAVRKDMALDDFDDDEDAPEEEAKRLPTEEELKAQYGANDLQRYFESPDGQVIAVKAYPRFKPQDVSRTTAFMKKIDTMLTTATAGHDVETVIVGDYTGVSKSVNAITDALARSSAVALLLIMAVLTLYFRRVGAIVLVLLPLLAGIGWTVCFARLFIGQLNLISAFIFAILIGLGIDFAVHAVSRVDESSREGRTMRDALVHALPRLGRAMAVAATTTIVTFLSLTIFDFRGFSQFGWIAAAGVALSLSAVYLLLPPLSLVLRRRAPKAKPTEVAVAPSSGRRGLAWCSIATVLVATGIAAVGLPDLYFDGDMRKMRLASPPVTNNLRLKYFAEAEPRLPSPALIITDDQAETERVYRHLVKLSKHERRLKSVVSLFTFVPENQDEKLPIVAEMKRRIDNKYGLLKGTDKADADRLRAYLSPSAFGVDDLPAWVRESFTDTTGKVGRYVLLYPSGVKSKAREVLEIQEAIGQVEIDGKTYHSTAAWMFTGDAFMMVQREGPLAVGLAALVVFLLLLADVRRLGAAVLTFLPLLLGFVLFLGVMAWAQISLNLFNVVVLPVIFGIGVDTAIHLTHRLREGTSVSEMLRTTGAAAGVSALTTAIGFGSLLTVSSEGLRSIGWVAVIGIVCTTLCTTTLIAAFATLQRPTDEPLQADA